MFLLEKFFFFFGVIICRGKSERVNCKSQSQKKVKKDQRKKGEIFDVGPNMCIKHGGFEFEFWL